MRTAEEVRQVFAFERWANGQVLESLESLLEPPPDLLALGGHLLGAIDIWLARIEGTQPAGGLWDTISLEDLHRRAEDVARRIEDFLEDLDDDDLQRDVVYRNSQGEEFTNRAGDILQHLALHGAEHRGQISFETGRLGGKSRETEYLWWLREPPEGER